MPTTRHRLDSANDITGVRRPDPPANIGERARVAKDVNGLFADEDGSGMAIAGHHNAFGLMLDAVDHFREVIAD